MPELKDVDDNYIYWQPDGGGAIQQTARTAETDKLFGADSVMSQRNFTPQPIAGGVGPDGAVGPTTAPAALPPQNDGGLKVEHLRDASPLSGPPTVGDGGIKVEHLRPDPSAIAAQIADKSSPTLPLPVPAGEQPPPGSMPASAPASQPAATASAPTAAPAAASQPAPGSHAQAEYFKALREQQKADGKLTNLAAQVEDEKAFTMATDAGAIQKFHVDQAEKAARQQQMVAADNQKLDDMTKEVRDGKIDPDGYWNEKGMGARIAAAIGMGLGAFGAAINGGQNGAAKIIEDLVQGHVNAQKVALGQKEKGVDAQRNKIAMLRQQGFDDQQADQGALVGGLEAAKAQLSATIQANSSDVVRANGQKLMGEIDQKIAGAKMQFAQAAAAAAQKKQLSANEQISLARLNHDVDKDKRGRMIRLADGSTGLAPTIEDATKLKESDENRLAMVGNLQRLRQIVSSTTPMNGETRDEAARISKELVTSYGVMKKLGALSDSDRELADQFRDPNAMLTGDKKIVDSINKYEGRINAGHNAMLKARLVTE